MRQRVLRSARSAARNPRADVPHRALPPADEDGAFGVRIENVMLVVAAGASDWRGAPAFAFGDAPWLELEPLTLVPIGGPLLDAAALSPDDRAWLNAYNARAAAALEPLLAGDARALAWLREHAAPV